LAGRSIDKTSDFKHPRFSLLFFPLEIRSRARRKVNLPVQQVAQKHIFKHKSQPNDPQTGRTQDSISADTQAITSQHNTSSTDTEMQCFASHEDKTLEIPRQGKNQVQLLREEGLYTHSTTSNTSSVVI
jgi:hypothetical protein